MATEAEIAWAAGFFEGEGSITSCGNRPRLQVVNTDRAVLGRFAMAVDAGRIYGPYTNGDAAGCRRKPRWLWVCEGAEIGDVLSLIGPWLSRRRLDAAYDLVLVPGLLA